MAYTPITEFVTLDESPEVKYHTAIKVLNWVRSCITDLTPIGWIPHMIVEEMMRTHGKENRALRAAMLDVEALVKLVAATIAGKAYHQIGLDDLGRGRALLSLVCNYLDNHEYVVSEIEWAQTNILTRTAREFIEGLDTLPSEDTDVNKTYLSWMKQFADESLTFEQVMANAEPMGISLLAANGHFFAMAVATHTQINPNRYTEFSDYLVSVGA